MSNFSHIDVGDSQTAINFDEVIDRFKEFLLTNNSIKAGLRERLDTIMKSEEIDPSNVEDLFEFIVFHNNKPLGPSPAINVEAPIFFEYLNTRLTQSDDFKAELLKFGRDIGALSGE